MINTYGKDLLKIIENERIICGGKIWGTSDKFLEFSKNLWKQMNSKILLNLTIIAQTENNFMIYYGKMFTNIL